VFNLFTRRNSEFSKIGMIPTAEISSNLWINSLELRLLTFEL